MAPDFIGSERVRKTGCSFVVNQKNDNRSFSRRRFLRATGTIGVLALTKADAGETGGFLSAFFSFDREIQKFMQARNIPGAALAVVKDQRLVMPAATAGRIAKAKFR